MAAAKFTSLLLCVVSEALGASLDDSSLVPSFAEFMVTHGRTYQPGTSEYAQRLALFEERVAQVHAQNAVPGQLWTAGINKLADRTDMELAQLRGYRHQARSSSSSSAQQPFELLGWASKPPSLANMPTSFTWAKHLKAMKHVEDQGGCGSCWAFAAATVLRAHSELYQKDRHFSQQQIVSCTPNPRQCGGEGGCKGATIELAMDYVAKAGCSTVRDMPYTGTDGTCPHSMLSLEGSEMSGHGGGAQFGMTGFQKLPENKLEPLLQALTERGPVGISLATGFKWNIYRHGIMNACQKDAVIDHAVTLVGYGQQAGTKYWQIQNSWGPSWGEGGFVRLQRHDHEKEAAYCGIDSKPEVGSGCEGGPSKVKVCGTCGILYDAVVPTFELSTTGWWAVTGNRTGMALRQNSTHLRHLRAHAPGK